MSFRDAVVDHITHYFSTDHMSLVAYIIQHANQHITGGEQEIPVATTTATGLSPILPDDDSLFLNGKGAYSAPPGAKDPPPIILYPIGAMVPETNPATVGQAELSNGVNYVYGEFSYTAAQKLQWLIDMPENWDEGYLTAFYRWVSISSSTNSVRFGLRATRLVDGVTFDTAPALIADSVVTDANGGASYINKSAESTPFLIPGTSGTASRVGYFKSYFTSDTHTVCEQRILVDIGLEPAIGETVVFTGQVPSTYTAGTSYYVVVSGSGYFKVSATLGGDPLAWTCQSEQFATSWTQTGSYIGKLILFELFRDYTDGGDTLDAAARILSVKIGYTVN